MADNAQAMRALNRLGKRRVLLAGWQLGTRPKGDPEADAVRDHREVTLMLRAENNAVLGLLLRKGVISEAEYQAAVIEAADQLNADLEAKFPGVTAYDWGLNIEPGKAPWLKDWRP